MKQTINLDQFRQAFHNMDRGGQFSYEALEVLFNYIEENEQAEGREWELDVIALCCEFSEMTMQEIFDAYPDVLDLIDMDRPRESTYSIVVDYLNDNGSYCGDTPQGTFVFQQF
jgi:hypothetical protein